MRLWIDNTGLHATGMSLNQAARAESDVHGLLQMATYLIFSDALLLNNYEDDFVRDRTVQFTQQLTELGLEADVIVECPYDAVSYASACRHAAETAAIDIEDAFVPVGKEIAGVVFGDIRAKTNEAEKDLHQFLHHRASIKDLEILVKSAIYENKSGKAVEYMFASSESLRDKIYRCVGNENPWTLGHTHQLNAFLRFYLNDTLAGLECAKYAPAVPRAKVVRRQNDMVIQKLLKELDEAVQLARGFSLMVPAVASYLVQRANGDPSGIIQESLRLREHATLLRGWLSTQIDKLNLEKTRDLKAAKEAIADLGAALRRELGIQKKATLRDALDVQFLLGVPVPSLSGVKLAQWVKERAEAKRIAVLTEISDFAVHPVREDHKYWKLRDSCLVR